MSARGDIEKILEVDSLGGNRFISKTLSVLPPGGRGTFGGELVAQALLAALHTVPYRYVPCSLHAYFVTAGNSKEYLEYQVEDIRRGRSFIHQEVKCYQGQRLVYWTAILWTLERPVSKDALHHLQRVPLQELDHLGSMKGAADLYRSHDSVKPKLFFEDNLENFEKGPMEYQFPSYLFKPNGPRERIDYCVRIRTPITRDRHNEKNEPVNPRNDLRYNYVALAYLSDLYFLFAVDTFYGKSLFDKSSLNVSLDHSIHFHGLPVVNDWLYFRIRHPRSAFRRIFIQGEYYDPSSREITASTSQEGATVYQVGDEKLKPKL